MRGEVASRRQALSRQIAREVAQVATESRSRDAIAVLKQMRLQIKFPASFFFSSQLYL